MIWLPFFSKRLPQKTLKQTPQEPLKEAQLSELFPLAIYFQGDYGMKLLMIDPQETIGKVAEMAKEALVGVVVKPLPEGTKLVVHRHGDSAVLDDSLKVADAGFIKMEALDILHAT